MTEKKLTGYPSIDKPWMKYYKYDPQDMQLRDESMYQMLERCNAERLDSIALELRMSNNDYDEGIKITYRQFIARIKDCAKALKALGVDVDEIIPIILPNIPESRIAIYALDYIGATAYPISPMVSPANLAGILKDNSSRTLIVFGAFWDKFADVVENSGVKQIVFVSGLESAPKPVQAIAKLSGKMPLPKVQKDATVLSWNGFIAKKNEIKQDIKPYYHAEHIAAIVGTSGTTGTSKGVCLTDVSLNASAIGQQIGAKYTPREVALDILIQSISYGLAAMHCFACFGCHTVVIPELITTQIAKVICKVKPNCFPGGPVHYINICHSDEFAKGLIPTIRCGFSGGATLDKDIESTLNHVTGDDYEESIANTLVRQGYGSTECCGVATANFVGSYKFGSIGIPMANTTLSVFKPGTDIECKYGEEGEICVTGPTVMKEYLNNPDETDNVLKLHSDGQVWLHQADLGWCDADGHFFMTDRIKNIFMRTGFNVHPSQIAEFISSLNGVNECTVVGVPHPDEQMVPVAFAVLKENAHTDENAAKAYLQQQCAKGLSESDLPYEWYFVDSLPRNIGGKIDSQALVKMCNVCYVKE